jgi:hypothetical protein
VLSSGSITAWVGFTILKACGKVSAAARTILINGAPGVLANLTLQRYAPRLWFVGALHVQAVQVQYLSKMLWDGKAFW